MTVRKAIKRIIIIFGVLLLLLIAVVLSYRFWVPRIAAPIASRFGVDFESFERLPNGRFVITDIEKSTDSFDLSISRLEGFFPDAWYRRVKAEENPTNALSYLEINGWNLKLHDKEDDDSPSDPKPDRGVYDYFKMAEKYLAMAREWLPRAALLNGSVEVKEKQYAFQTITWEEGILAADGIWPISQVPIEIKGKLTGEEPYQVSYAMHPLDLRARLRLWETNAGLETTLAAFFKDNRADISARFGKNGVIPEVATVKAPEFQFPGELLKLKDFREVTGSARAEWLTNRYTVTLEAHGEPLSTVTNIPPFDIELAATGDTNRVRVEELKSSAPGLRLSISEPLELTYKGKMLSERSVIDLAVDFEKLPWVDLKGLVEGKIILEQGDRFPRALLRAEGRNLSGYRLAAQAVSLEGSLDWPHLEGLELALTLPEASSVEITGSANLETRELRTATLAAEGLIAPQLLPTNVTYRSLSLKAQAGGPLTNLSHSGQLTLNKLETAHTTTMDLQSRWKGQHLDFSELALMTRAGPATLFLNSSISTTATATNLTLRELTLSKGDEVHLELAEPTLVTLTNRAGKPMIAIQPLDWQGMERRLRLAGEVVWPSQGDISLQAESFNPELFQFFVKRSLSGLDIPALALDAHWDNGPLYGTVRGEVSLLHEQLKRIRAGLNFELDDNGLTLSDFAFSDPSGVVATARGFLPLAIHPLDPTRPVHLAKSEQLNFSLQTAPNETFWNSLEQLTQARLSNAAVRLTLSGTVTEPQGKLLFRTEGVELPRIERPLPEIGAIEGEIVLDEQELTIPRLDLAIEGQRVSVDAAVELGRDFWEQRREEIKSYLLDHVQVNVRAPSIELAAFAELLPKEIAPQGTITVDAGLRPGRMLTGNAYVTGMATRPLPKMGVVEGIRANVALDGRAVQIANIQGTIGGEVLRLSGAVNFAETNLALGYPGLDLKIRGENVPLARNPDVILRSDLAVDVVNGTNHVPVIRGTATLQDSFLLRDITTLVPGGVASPARRPPYFTIPQDPVDDWKLDVRVKGENFMRVRSPFFQGQVSTTMHVTGTLEEPIALGEAAITSGRILFPFATLEVKQAIVSLTSENPYLPQVFAVAVGRAFGYDVRMEVEGPADEPVIEFSSVPALTSEQIVLMITTGQIPREDFSFSNQEKASRLAVFLGKNLISKLNPGEPAQERLTIRSGEDISEQGKQTYSVEYKINDKWSLVGEYDRFGALNADVKWKVFSR